MCPGVAKPSLFCCGPGEDALSQARQVKGNVETWGFWWFVAWGLFVWMLGFFLCSFILGFS